MSGTSKIVKVSHDAVTLQQLADRQRDKLEISLGWGAVDWLLALVGLLTWAGVTLLLDARRRRRCDLIDRLRPFQPRSVADQAHAWLDHQ
jgi:hypothetical protein